MGEKGWAVMRRFSSSIIQFHLGHKVAATPGLVHGSIYLILKAKRKINHDHNINEAL